MARAPAPRGPTADAPPRRNAGRVAFYAHLWIGVLFTVALIAIAITGILLNHKRGLGLQPDVADAPTAAFTSARPLDELAQVALRAAAGTAAPDTSVRTIDRMDVRPRNGYVKVRLRDAASTEVTVDLASGRVLHVGPRGDVFLEKLHSGEILGDRGVLLGDAAAIALLLTLVSGYWLWLAPKLRGGTRQAAR